MVTKNLELPFAESVRIGTTYATVIRSPRRRTVEIQIRDGEAVVRAPAGISTRRLHTELQHSAPWVEQKLAQARNLPREVERRFVDCETIPYLGRQLVLEVRRGIRSAVQESSGVLTVLVSRRVRKREEFIRNSIIRWIGEQGYPHLEQRADHFAGQMNVDWRGLRIKSFKRLWGNCSRQGDLAFNWRIMMAPPSVVDYVVAHELAHRIEFNHSARFWNLVESVIPDYRDQRAWLHHNSSLLNV